MSEIYLMMTISKRSVAKRILMCYEQNGLPSVLCTLAQGTATSETLDYFGLEVTEKTVMLAVVTDNTWKTVKRELEDRFQIDVPGTGIAFLMPLSSIGGKKVMQFLLDGQVYEMRRELRELAAELRFMRWEQGLSARRNSSASPLRMRKRLSLL